MKKILFPAENFLNHLEKNTELCYNEMNIHFGP